MCKSSHFSIFLKTVLFTRRCQIILPAASYAPATLDLNTLARVASLKCMICLLYLFNIHFCMLTMCKALIVIISISFTSGYLYPQDLSSDICPSGMYTYSLKTFSIISLLQSQFPERIYLFLCILCFESTFPKFSYLTVNTIVNDSYLHFQMILKCKKGCPKTHNFT